MSHGDVHNRSFTSTSYITYEMTAKNHNERRSSESFCSSQNSLQQNLYCLSLLFFIRRLPYMLEALTSVKLIAQLNEARESHL